MHLPQDLMPPNPNDPVSTVPPPASTHIIPLPPSKALDAADDRTDVETCLARSLPKDIPPGVFGAEPNIPGVPGAGPGGGLDCRDNAIINEKGAGP